MLHLRQTSGVSSIMFGDGQTGDLYRGYVQYNTLILVDLATSRLTIDDNGRFRVSTISGY